MAKNSQNYDRSRSFLLITYKLYGHLSRLKGQAKGNAINVYLALMKYAWKSKGYSCGVRYSTLATDTGLSHRTTRRTIQSLAKLNVITIKRLRSANEYTINPIFIKSERSKLDSLGVLNGQSDRSYLDSINRSINNIKSLSKIDKIIANGNDKDSIVRQLADTIALPDLLSDKRNVYYCKLAIALKKENDKPKVELNTGAVLKDLKKKTNQFYKSKVEFNKRNNLDWKGRPKNGR